MRLPPLLWTGLLALVLEATPPGALRGASPPGSGTPHGASGGQLGALHHPSRASAPGRSEGRAMTPW